MRLYFFMALILSMGVLAKEWKEESLPKLNFFEIKGYFRNRMNIFSRCDLGTFVPLDRLPVDSPFVQGTSACPVPTSYNGSENSGKNSADRPNTLFSNDLRLRLEPTLNVSEDIRIQAQVDILDNVVLGSSRGLYSSGNYPYSFLSATQYNGSSSPYVDIKRAWAEVDTPMGEFRFGRIPINFGLGLLYSSAPQITNDYGDNVDGLMLATQLWEHYVIPGIFISSAAEFQRGGGLGTLGDNRIPFALNEWGQRYNLDPSDDAYTFVLGFVKINKESEIKALLIDQQWVLNYGTMASYRFQINDSVQVNNTWVMKARNSNVGFLSVWANYYWNKLHIEGELVGVVGKIGNSSGLWEDASKSDSLSILQAGIALQSRYGFLENKLGVGLDAGWASGDSAYGMGARPGLNKSVKKGDADGQQFVGNDTSITNFRFNPAYQIDQLLFKEIIGTVTDAFYVKPHISYDFTPALGARLDAISSFANFAESTPGQSHLLGLEFDASLYYKTQQGLFVALQYGLLIPFSGLNHSSEQLQNNRLYEDFGTARLASAFQLFAGIAF